METRARGCTARLTFNVFICCSSSLCSPCFFCCNAVTTGGSLSQFVVDAQPNFATKTMTNRFVLEGLLYFAGHMTSQCRIAGLYTVPDRHSSERTLNCRCGLKCNAGDGNFKMSKLYKSPA